MKKTRLYRWYQKRRKPKIVKFPFREKVSSLCCLILQGASELSGRNVVFFHSCIKGWKSIHASERTTTKHGAPQLTTSTKTSCGITVKVYWINFPSPPSSLSFWFLGNWPTTPSPKPTICPKWEVSDNVGLGEGWAVSHKPKLIQYIDHTVWWDWYKWVTFDEFHAEKWGYGHHCPASVSTFVFLGWRRR